MMVKSGLEEIFEIPPCACHFLLDERYVPIEGRNFDQKYKFGNKNDLVSAWRNFKNIFSRPLFTVIFWPEILKFHPYSILTWETMIGFAIYCVLIQRLIHSDIICDKKYGFYR